jgi:hypothetical protein
VVDSASSKLSQEPCVERSANLHNGETQSRVASGSYAEVLAFQQTTGNRVVSQLLRSVGSRSHTGASELSGQTRIQERQWRVGRTSGG